ncbi:MAG: TerB family tellurite resistance protein [Brucellaceae bacterium]|nr:TerB family tellurite resistance protein [Brucellaceae bacterium]
MPNRILGAVREFFEGNASVRKVADDPLLTAELLLLFRMILADGRIAEEELVLFRRICSESFGIPEDDLPKVIEYLQDFGYETTGRQAIEAFKSMERDRRVALMKHMVAMAKADEELNAQEVKLAKRIAAMLDLTEDDGEASPA